MPRTTLLDVLSTLETTPDILTQRAQYWDGVATRHFRHGRNDQGTRLVANADAMRKEANRLARLSKVEKLPHNVTRRAIASAMTRQGAMTVKVAPSAARKVAPSRKVAPLAVTQNNDSFRELRAIRRA